MAKLKKGLVTGLAVVAVLAMVAPVSWAQQRDPLAIGGNGSTEPGTGRPAALEGGYVTGTGLLQFLAIAAPQDCINGQGFPFGECPESTGHMWFYNASCTRVGNKAVPLTRNDLAIIPLHSSSVTTNRVGNFLVASVAPEGSTSQVLLTTFSIIGQSWFVDAVRGIGRIEPTAVLSQHGWYPYSPAKVLLVGPPDDGTFVQGTLIFRCPVGTALQKANTALDDDAEGGTVIGTINTLGGDMLDLANQMDDAGTPGNVFDPNTTTAQTDTLCDRCTYAGVFARAINADVFDDKEEHIGSVDGMPCRCLGAADPVNPTAFVNEIRLSTLIADAATKVTYWEVFGAFIPGVAGGPSGDLGIFVANLNVRANLTSLGAGIFNFFTPLHTARDADNIASQ